MGKMGSWADDSFLYLKANKPDSTFPLSHFSPILKRTAWIQGIKRWLLCSVGRQQFRTMLCFRTVGVDARVRMCWEMYVCVFFDCDLESLLVWGTSRTLAVRGKPGEEMFELEFFAVKGWCCHLSITWIWSNSVAEPYSKHLNLEQESGIGSIKKKTSLIPRNMFIFFRI